MSDSHSESLPKATIWSPKLHRMDNLPLCGSEGSGAEEFFVFVFFFPTALYLLLKNIFTLGEDNEADWNHMKKKMEQK